RFRELVEQLDVEAAEATGPGATALAMEAAAVVEDELGELGDAARRLEAIHGREPSRRDLAAHARGLYLAVGEHERALSLLEREVSGAPPSDAATLRLIRADLLFGLGRDGEAELELAASVEAAPGFGPARATLGEVRLRRGDVD